MTDRPDDTLKQQQALAEKGIQRVIEAAQRLRMCMSHAGLIRDYEKLVVPVNVELISRLLRYMPQGAIDWNTIRPGEITVWDIIFKETHDDAKG